MYIKYKMFKDLDLKKENEEYIYQEILKLNDNEINVYFIEVLENCVEIQLENGYSKKFVVDRLVVPIIARLNAKRYFILAEDIIKNLYLQDHVTITYFKKLWKIQKGDEYTEYLKESNLTLLQLLKLDYNQFSDELISIAMLQDTKILTRSVLNLALKLNKDNHVAKAYLIINSPGNKTKKLTTLLEEAKICLIKEEKIKGDFDSYDRFWGDISSRSYMIINQLLARNYIVNKNYYEALDIYYYLLKINENDNQGIRFEISFLKEILGVVQYNNKNKNIYEVFLDKIIIYDNLDMNRLKTELEKTSNQVIIKYVKSYLKASCSYYYHNNNKDELIVAKLLVDYFNNNDLFYKVVCDIIFGKGTKGVKQNHIRNFPTPQINGSSLD